jgi:Cof subfamily protein (haloacid dehalogenase superfamily)
MKMLVHPLELVTPLACFNGGVFTAPDLKPLEVEAVDPAAVTHTVSLLEESDADVWIYTDRDWLIRDPNKPHVAREQWTVKFPPTVVEGFERLPDPVIKIVGVSDDYAGLATIEEAIHRRLGSAVSASRSQPYYLDITSPEANKGKVVDFFARRFGVSPGAMAALGDGNNDILMFRKVGLGIAVGNANETVKRAANATVAPNDADGFAEAVDRFILRPKEGTTSITPPPFG